METSIDYPSHKSYVTSNSQTPAAVTTGPLTEFTLFPKLIIELRLKIWALYSALQPGRLVEVRTHLHDCAEHTGTRYCPRFSPSRIPVLVHTSHEARMVAREQAQRAGHLCFSTPASSLPAVIFNPEIDRLYLPVEKEPWMENGGEERVRARTRQRRPRVPYIHAGLRPVHHHHHQPPPPAATDASSAPPAAIPRTTLAQFKKVHQPASVRFLVADLDIHPHRAAPDPVWTVMQDFANVEELVFVVPEHWFAYAELVGELTRTAELVGLERERWAHAAREGVVAWKWPDVRLAMRCKGSLKFVELEGRYD